MISAFRTSIILLLTTISLACQRDQAPTFAEFVDQYLDDFASRHPSIAAGNGLHQHDDLLDDYSAAGIRSEIASLKRDAETLAMAAVPHSAAMTTRRRVLALMT